MIYWNSCAILAIATFLPFLAGLMLPFLDFFALRPDWYGVQTAHLVSGHPAPLIRQLVW